MESSYLTPVEFIDGIYFKRDDYFVFHNVNGGKVRSALKLCEVAVHGLVTAGSRKSPQIQIISEIAKYKNLPFIAITPCGSLTPELKYAKKNGAIIEQIKMGFNNNLIIKAKKKALELNYTYIPFGMEDVSVINPISDQVQNIPNDVKNIIVPVGSGITLSGILNGLIKYNMNKSVTGIVVGADPVKRLDRYAPTNNLFSDNKEWRSLCKLIKSPVDYHKEIKNNIFCGIELDPIYEAKCIEYINKGDLFWIIGKGIRDFSE